MPPEARRIQGIEREVDAGNRRAWLLVYRRTANNIPVP